MAKPGRPDAPRSLGKAGKALWRQIIGGLDDDWQLDRREEAILLEAARTADEMVPLRKAVEAEPLTVGSKGQVVVHPAQQEVRQLRQTQARLLAAIEMRDPRAESITTQRARRAANARWDGERLKAVNG